MLYCAANCAAPLAVDGMYARVGVYGVAHDTKHFAAACESGEWHVMSTLEGLDDSVYDG